VGYLTNPNSYAELTIVLKSKEVIMACKICLGDLHHLLSSLNLWSGKYVEASSVVGCFLAAYMIENHSKTVFESFGSQENDLLLSAQRLLNEFDKIATWCSSLQANDPVSITLLIELLKTYPAALALYLNLFRAWKSRDQVRLRDQMLRSLLSVVDALGRPSAYSSGPDPTESMAAAASRVMPTGRTLSAADTETLDLDRLRLLAQVKTLRERLRRIGSTEVVADFDFKHPWLVAELEAAEASDFAISGSDHMSNEQLAHEVLLDPSYRLSADDDTEGKSAPEKNRALQAAFWAGVEEELQRKPSGFGRVLRVLCQVRDGVAAVAPPAVKTDLCELVDEDLIRQQVDKGLYGWKECVDLISNITKIICRIHTPERRAQTEKLWAVVKAELEAADVSVQSQQLCRGLQFLLARANVARVDVGNQRLIPLAQTIKDQGVKYEREKFDEKLKSGAFNVDKTRAWLRSALLAHPESQVQVAENNASAHRHVLSAAMAKFAAEYRGTGCPETLLLDLIRLRTLAVEFRKFVLLAKAILAVRASLAGSGCPARTVDDAAAAVAQLLLRLDSETNAEIPSSAAEVAASVAGSSCFEAVQAAVGASLAAPADGVAELLQKRLLEVWRHVTAGEEASLSAMSLGSGLEALWPAVQRSARMLGRMAAVNVEVHWERYSVILCEEAKGLLEKRRCET
jgi:hypothetical protein